MSAKKMITDAIEAFTQATKEEGWIYEPLDALIATLTELKGFARNDEVRAKSGPLPVLYPDGYVAEAETKEEKVEAKAAAKEEKAEAKEETKAEEPKTEAPESVEPKAEVKPAAKKTAAKTATPAPEQNNNQE
jgi:hypothetical protein